MLSSSYRPFSLPDTVGNLSKKVVREVNKCILLCDKQFRYQPRLRNFCSWQTLLQESTSFDEKRLTGTVFLDVAKPSAPCGSEVFFIGLLS
jgi:hypothetical protein